MSRKKNPTVTILKFKKGKSTYTLPVSLEELGAPRLAAVVDKLVDVINQSGGLKDDDDDDIDIPESDFAPEAPSLSADRVSVAVPKDKSAPYDNQWIALDEDTFEELVWADYDVLAFRCGDEDFHIVEPNYEDQ